jgi:hypothetical protein
MATRLIVIIEKVIGLIRTVQSKATRAHVPLALGLSSLDFPLLLIMRLPLSATLQEGIWSVYTARIYIEIIK